MGTNNRGRQNQLPWVEFLDSEIAASDSQTVRHGILKIFRRTLFSARGSLPSEAAQQIDSYYQETYLPSNPGLRNEPDKGMTNFLTGLYGVIFDLVLLIPYHHGLQYSLIDFLFELRNLPPQKVKIGNEDHIVYDSEPIFPRIMDEKWDGHSPKDNADGAELEKKCGEWVNFSAFVARCIEAGLNDHFKDGCKYPCVDIPKALEEDNPPGVRRSCLIRVAVQYVMLAGSKICQEKIGKGTTDEQRKWLDKWKIWAEKLLELAEKNELEPGLTSEVREAHGTMVALQPRLFKFKR